MQSGSAHVAYENLYVLHAWRRWWVLTLANHRSPDDKEVRVAEMLWQRASAAEALAEGPKDAHEGDFADELFEHGTQVAEGQVRSGVPACAGWCVRVMQA